MFYRGAFNVRCLTTDWKEVMEMLETKQIPFTKISIDRTAVIGQTMFSGHVPQNDLHRLKGLANDKCIVETYE